MNTILGGYIIDADLKRHQIPVISNPDNSVDKTLLTIKMLMVLLG